MTVPQPERASWTIQEAERLLTSLQGVVSARVVARPGGDVDEIHMLTTTEVRPKQTVRNVESALLAHLDLPVDHRKISVAQTQDRAPQAVELPEPESPVRIMPEPQPWESRLLFYGHHLETERHNQVRHRVQLEWRGERYTGEQSAADRPRQRLEAVAGATLAAIEAALHENLEESRPTPAITLDGVKLVEAFDRSFVLVAVHATAGRAVARLSGSHAVDESTDRAAILATLQATDRWVRGNFYS